MANKISYQINGQRLFSKRNEFSKHSGVMTVKQAKIKQAKSLSSDGRDFMPTVEVWTSYSSYLFFRSELRFKLTESLKSKMVRQELFSMRGALIKTLYQESHSTN